MRVVLKSAEYTDFRGIREKLIEFDPVSNTIEQPNGTGKTTLEDGFHWVIESKNSNGDSQFKVQSDNVDDPKTKVTLVLDIDGKEVVLSKTPGKWSFNSIECNKSVFEDFLSNIQSIETLRFLSNPMSFMRLHWESRRNFLTKMFCEKISEDSEFSFFMKSMTISDVRKSKSQAKKIANDGLTKCNTIIGVHEKSIAEVFEIDFLSLKLELSAKTAEIEKLSNFDYNNYYQKQIQLQGLEKDFKRMSDDWKTLNSEYILVKDDSYEKSLGCAQCGTKVPKEKFEELQLRRLDSLSAQLETKKKAIIAKKESNQVVRDAFKIIEKDKPSDTVSEILIQLKSGERLLSAQIAKENDIISLNAKIKDEQTRLDSYAKDILQIDSFMDRFNSFLVDNYYKSINENFDGLFFDVENECRCTNAEGTEYKDFSLSEKINAGVQIVSVLSKKIGLQFPLWIDNRESVTNLYPIDTQVINLKVLDIKNTSKP